MGHQQQRRRRRLRRRLRHYSGLLHVLAKAGALLLLVLLVALSITPTTAAAAAVGPDDDVPDPFAGVRGIVLRLLGEGKGQAFLARVDFATLPVPSDGNDVFELESAGAGGDAVVAIRGSSPLALATGLGWYLRYYCKAYPGSWDNRRVAGKATGRQLETVDPERLPRVSPKLRRHSGVRWRYYMNVCTVSYSMAWWDWARWEEELDWMALSGINLALAFNGQEYIWTQLFEEFGVARDDLTGGWFTGPAFAAWQRMGNIQKWGGPLSYEGFIEPQHQLQLQILARMRLLGITPVLPAFAGFLPPALIALLPANASVTRLPDWNRFEAYEDMSGVYLLEPTDPFFVALGRRFIELQQAAYGGANVTHMYASDTYNEMDPRTNDPAYLKRASAGVIAGMRAADPAAVWVMQGWLFHSNFWTPAAMAAYLSGVPSGALLVLDLNSNAAPVWPQLVDNNAPFVWCVLHNYGGRRALYGNLPVIAVQPRRDWARAREWMVGTGVTMEAIEHNPVVFDLMLEMAWRLRDEASVEVHAWAGEYAERRYGTADPRVKEAWGLLVDGVYSIGEEGSYALLSPIAREPRMGLECERLTDVEALAEAWGLLVAAAADSPNATAVVLSPWGYDLVDVTRQALADAFVETLDAFESAFDAAMRAQPTQGQQPGGKMTAAVVAAAAAAVPARAQLRATAARERGSGSGTGPLRVFVNSCAAGTNTTMDRLRCLGARLLQIIDDTEEILASNANFLFGTWVAAARAWGRTEEERDLLEFNCRNQVTLWGPEGQINDYASKQWAGLTRDYHRARWNLFVEQALATAADPDAGAFDEDGFHETVIAFGKAFDRQTVRDVRYPTAPVGDTVAIARRLHREYLGRDV